MHVLILLLSNKNICPNVSDALDYSEPNNGGKNIIKGQNLRIISVLLKVQKKKKYIFAFFS